MKLRNLLPAAAGIFLITAVAPGQVPTSPNSRSYEVAVPATSQWVETNVTAGTGARLRFTASGEITYPHDESYKGKTRTSGTFGPDGLARGWSDLVHQYPVRDAGHGALIGRIGSDQYAQPFPIGESKEYDVPVGGKLYLGLNEGQDDAANASGSFHVKIEILNEGSSESANAGGPADKPIPGIGPDLLSKIPRRVTDQSGAPGDMVNVLIIGTQEQVLQAFSAAGWVQVDKTVKETAMEAVLDSLKKSDYLTMPMSVLYLFNRPQDFGFAHAEPLKVAMSRNHLRVWKSPLEVDGRPLWCVAATHDIGIERDQRNNGLTHKIDPAIDGEREYVDGTLTQTGLVAQRDHVQPADALTSAKTATGGEFHSDGRIAVLALRDSAVEKASAAARQVPR